MRSGRYGRGSRSAVQAKTLAGIVRGWVTGPPTSFLLARTAALVVRWVWGADTLAS